MPVDLHGSGDVADVVQQHVFVGFDNLEARRTEIRREPFRRDQPVGMRELGKRG